MRRTPQMVLYVDDDFKITMTLVDLGLGRLMPMVHLEFNRFNPSILRRYMRVHESLRPLLPEQIFAQPRVDDHLFRRFSSKFGFSVLSDGYCTDGVNRHIYINKN